MATKPKGTSKNGGVGRTAGAKQTLPSKTPPGMHKFENRDVIASTCAIVGAGDGLSADLVIEPREYQLGQKLTLVMEVEVTKVGYVPVKNTAALARHHTLRQLVTAIVDEDFGAETIEAQRIRLEEAAGVTRLPLGASDGDAATDD